MGFLGFFFFGGGGGGVGGDIVLSLNDKLYLSNVMDEL